MRGKLAREGAFTLQVQWLSEADEIDCDACSTEESGEYFTVYLPDGQPFVLCHTCTVMLAADLAYALG